MCTSPCDAVLVYPHCMLWMHQEGEAASQHLVQLSGMQRCKPWGRCMARQEHVGTRGGDGRASDHSFFNDTPLLSPRSSCSSSCSVLNKAKPFSQKYTASQNRARKDSWPPRPFFTLWNTQQIKAIVKKSCKVIFFLYKSCSHLKEL